MVGNELFLEDVTVGGEIEPLVKKITLVQMVMYAAATWDFNRGHYEREFALSQGFRDVYVDGQMLGAYLAQLMTDWMGQGGTLKRLAVRYMGMVFPGDVITCGGKVAQKYAKDGEGLVDCELWIENRKGEKVTLGVATVALPSKGTGLELRDCSSER